MMLPQRHHGALIPLPGRRFRQVKYLAHLKLAGAIQRHAENQIRVPADDCGEVAPQFRTQTQLLRP